MNVMAAATSDTMITVTWEAPASNGGSDITGYMVQSKYGDGEWMDVDPAHTGMDMMYMDTGLMSGTTYYYRVLAMNAAGNSEWSDGMAMAMTEEAPDTTLGDAIGLMMVETDIDPGTIELTWTAGANANVHRVAGARKNDDGSFDLTDQVWELVEGNMQNSFTVDGNALNLSPGTYLFAVIAGQRDDSGQTTWGSTWAVLDNVAHAHERHGCRNQRHHDYRDLGSARQ
jgi:hypothetical protein